ncbi:MAG TPA: hypothetical protein VF970_11865 [Gemmatimonadales bacterium]
MKSTMRFFAAVCGAALLVACSDSLSPGDQLTPAETDFLANELAATSLDGLSEGMGVMPGPQGAPAHEGTPPEGVISWHRSYEVTRECPVSGTRTVGGTVDGEFDRATRTGTLTVTHFLNMVECARQRGELTITLTTSPPITMEGTVNFAQGERRTGEFTKTGTFFWEVSDGRSGTCEVNLTITWDADGQHHTTGTMCRREINQLTSS